MQIFNDHLTEELKDTEFSKLYENELELLQLAVKIAEERKEKGLSQKELASKAHITQQQMSKIENGINCNMITFLKVCQVLGISLKMEKELFNN